MTPGDIAAAIAAPADQPATDDAAAVGERARAAMLRSFRTYRRRKPASSRIEMPPARLQPDDLPPIGHVVDVTLTRILGRREREGE